MNLDIKISLIVFLSEGVVLLTPIHVLTDIGLNGTVELAYGHGDVIVTRVLIDKNVIQWELCDLPVLVRFHFPIVDISFPDLVVEHCVTESRHSQHDSFIS